VALVSSRRSWPVKYQAFLTAGVERWREYRNQLAPLAKKPILFVMLNSTNDADDVADYLRKTYPDEFSGEKLLIIHTDKKGDCLLYTSPSPRD